ncbi:zinc finger protein, predicted [Trypanosoma conorhini]|uniref:Zinc finger protein, predicted n=1 Tax=Trypanosoma conorhini TaxID=83891 RepID=A0A3R7NYM5_9TRYP|nr:zinc finger protein, predicted [Trypanosoma conorhini]RNF25912.1 zinc finger protein, predicted [Trypanosoma conorhini]
MTIKGTIRFEDLGEPVQRLLRSLRAGYTDEDMALLEYVSVKDMAKIYGEMSSDRHAEEIWDELRAALKARQEKAARRELELHSREQQLALEREADERARREQEELEEAERQAAEARRERREARRKRREEQAEEEAAAAAAAAEEAAMRAAEEEERQRKAEKRRKRREARERELQEQQEALEAERQKHAAGNSTSQKKAWEEYVASHPLEFGGCNQNIEQKHVEHKLKAPPAATKELLNRTYTPKCPRCATKFMVPPKAWDCPLCLRRTRLHIKVWQPDDSSSECMICHTGIGRFSRHHCRSCGRLVCDTCSMTKAVIPALGFNVATKICDDCAQLGRRLVSNQ